MTVEKAVQVIKGGFAFRAGRELRYTPQFGKRDSRKSG